MNSINFSTSKHTFKAAMLLASITFFITDTLVSIKRKQRTDGSGGGGEGKMINHFLFHLSSACRVLACFSLSLCNVPPIVGPGPYSIYT